MANFMKITTDPDHINIEFRDLQSDPNVDISNWNMGRGYVEWAQKNNVGGITIKMKSGRKFDVTLPAIPIDKHLPIDDINGPLTITTNDELLDKITNEVLIRLY